MIRISYLSPDLDTSAFKETYTRSKRSSNPCSPPVSRYTTTWLVRIINDSGDLGHHLHLRFIAICAVVGRFESPWNRSGIRESCATLGHSCARSAYSGEVGQSFRSKYRARGLHAETIVGKTRRSCAGASNESGVYSGVFAPRAKLRSRIVPSSPPVPAGSTRGSEATASCETAAAPEGMALEPQLPA